MIQTGTRAASCNNAYCLLNYATTNLAETLRDTSDWQPQIQQTPTNKNGTTWHNKSTSLVHEVYTNLIASDAEPAYPGSFKPLGKWGVQRFLSQYIVHAVKSYTILHRHKLCGVGLRHPAPCFNSTKDFDPGWTVAIHNRQLQSCQMDMGRMLKFALCILAWCI